MLHINTVHVQRETLWVKQLAGEQYKMICSAWACKHTYIAEPFVGLCTHSSVWKVSSAHRGECVTTGGLYRPTHLSNLHTSNCTKKSFIQFFLWCGKVGACLGGGVQHSQWCPCRMWWGWVEGDLLFSASGESVGAVVPFWRVTWCWWSRWDPLWCAPPGI